jgi:hypothetical protein
MKRKSSTIKFLEEVRLNPDVVVESMTRPKNRTTRNSRGDSLSDAHMSFKDHTSLAQIPVRKWEKKQVRIGSMIISQYMPNRPERTPGLIGASKYSKKASKLRGRKNLKYSSSGGVHFAGQVIDEQDAAEGMEGQDGAEGNEEGADDLDDNL